MRFSILTTLLILSLSACGAKDGGKAGGGPGPDANPKNPLDPKGDPKNPLDPRSPLPAGSTIKWKDAKSEMTYDATGELVEATIYIENGEIKKESYSDEWTKEISYNEDGWLITEISTGWDQDNLTLTEVTRERSDEHDNTVEETTAQYSYGELIEETTVTTTREYDADGRMTLANASDGEHTTYVYDDNGQKIKEIREQDDSLVEEKSWEYDDAGRLTKSVTPTTTSTWDYDTLTKTRVYDGDKTTTTYSPLVLDAEINKFETNFPGFDDYVRPADLDPDEPDFEQYYFKTSEVTVRGGQEKTVNFTVEWDGKRLISTNDDADQPSRSVYEMISSRTEDGEYFIQLETLSLVEWDHGGEDAKWLTKIERGDHGKTTREHVVQTYAGNPSLNSESVTVYEYDDANMVVKKTVQTREGDGDGWDKVLTTKYNY